MKTSYGVAAGAMAALLAVGPAAAAEYVGVGSFDGGKWLITWPATADGCASEIVTQISGGGAKVTIDGTTYTSLAWTFVPAMPARWIFDSAMPDGQLTRATVNGADYLTCGADRLLLPGYVAPPAPVPTMTEWAMILLGVMLAGGAALTVHRRRTA